MLWRTLPKREEEKTVAEARRYPSEPQETCSIYGENAPLLESWQREILRIVRKVSQYFIRKTDSGDERRLGDLLALYHP